MSVRGTSLARTERGMALVSSLLLLLVVTIIAMSMFRSFGVQEKIAGNTREKQRALASAVSAQQYGEWFLSSGSAPTSAACTGTVGSAVGQVCTNALADFTAIPWAYGVSYDPFTAAGNNGVTASVTGTAPVAGSYYKKPLFYITDLGAQPGATGTGEVYQIDAVGYGGTANAVAVVESTYLVTTNTAKSPDK
jgi:type IV pilus assembly protein PilX